MGLYSPAPANRMAFIRDLLGRAGELGMTTDDVTNMFHAGGVAVPRDTVAADLGAMLDVELVEHRGGDEDRWFLPAGTVEHAWAVQQRSRATRRRCARCLLWETTESRARPCRGRPATMEELRRELDEE